MPLRARLPQATTLLQKWALRQRAGLLCVVADSGHPILDLHSHLEMHVYIFRVPAVCPMLIAGALEAYALALGARGPQWRTMCSVSLAFMQLRQQRLALACAAASLQLCPSKYKGALISELRNAQILGDISPAEYPVQLPKVSDNIETAARYCREMNAIVTLPAAVSLTYCALQRRGGVDVLCSRVSYYLGGSSDIPDDDVDAPRSVQSL